MMKYLGVVLVAAAAIILAACEDDWNDYGGYSRPTWMEWNDLNDYSMQVGTRASECSAALELLKERDPLAAIAVLEATEWERKNFLKWDVASDSSFMERHSQMKDLDRHSFAMNRELPGGCGWGIDDPRGDSAPTGTGLLNTWADSVPSLGKLISHPELEDYGWKVMDRMLKCYDTMFSLEGRDVLMASEALFPRFLSLIQILPEMERLASMPESQQDAAWITDMYAVLEDIDRFFFAWNRELPGGCGWEEIADDSTWNVRREEIIEEMGLTPPPY